MALHAGRLLAFSQPQAGDVWGQLASRIAGRIQLGLRSNSTRYGLRRDLNLPLQKPNAKIPISVRALAEADVPSLLAVDHTTSRQERIEIVRRRAFVDKGVKQGFVAIDLRSNTPCYVQWLLGPADNAVIQRFGGFPLLGKDEALLENAYTPAAYRGLGIMSGAMALIAERANDLGVRHVLTFVDHQNIPSLKGCQRAGFHPHMLHHWSQIGFALIKHDEFEILPDADPRRTMKF